MNEKNVEIQTEVNVINHVRCKYNDNGSIIVGKLENGNLILHVGDKDPPVPYCTLFLPEDDLVGLMTALMEYLRQQGIDFSQKAIEYYEENRMKLYAAKDDK